MGFGNNLTVAVEWKSVWDVRPMTRPEGARVSFDTATDHELVRAFVDGQHTAFDTIVLRHRRGVYRLCYRFVDNHEDAADLTQDVFIRAFRGLKTFKGDASLATWLYRVAVNTCLNRVSVKRPVFAPIEPDVHVDTRAVDPFEAIARDERCADVRRHIHRLPPKQRATLILRVYQELPHEEIARILGSSVGAVKANFFHALGNLRRLMQS